MQKLAFCLAATAALFGSAAWAEESDEYYAEDDAPFTETDPSEGLLGEISAGLLYSDEFGLTGTANLKYFLPGEPKRAISGGLDLSENRRAGHLGYYQADVLGGADLSFSLRGHAEGQRDALPFDIEALGVSARLTWQDVAGGTLSASIRHTTNKMDNPALGLSNILLPDVKETDRNSVSLDYSRGFSFESEALSRAKFSFGIERATISDGRDQWRGEVSALLGGEIGSFAVWRGDLRLGALNTSGGASAIGERFILGPATLRGFEYAGFGPRDGSTALGGNRFAAARFDMMFPRAFGENSWLTPGIHADVGSLWGLDFTDGGRVDDSRHSRSSVGMTLSAKFAAGSISLNVSHALDSQPGDETQNVQLNMQASF